MNGNDYEEQPLAQRPDTPVLIVSAVAPNEMMREDEFGSPLAINMMIDKI